MIGLAIAKWSAGVPLMAAGLNEPDGAAFGQGLMTGLAIALTCLVLLVGVHLLKRALSA
ncbi:MAG: hypothetical protein ACJ762_11335 [Solirubrobacteraceae bacterium]